MSDASYEPDDDAQDDPSPRDLRHQLAERSREAGELRAQLEATKKEAEFTRALGENANAPWVKYFQAGYDGDVNAEAIRQAATDAGFITQPQSPPAEAAPAWPSRDPDLAAHARMAAASDGGNSSIPIDVLEQIRAAQSPDEVLAVIESDAGQRAGLRSIHQNQ